MLEEELSKTGVKLKDIPNTVSPLLSLKRVSALNFYVRLLRISSTRCWAPRPGIRKKTQKTQIVEGELEMS